jgi:1-acyl-sn-glycerol-3-phosphate acyltransferase
VRRVEKKSLGYAILRFLTGIVHRLTYKHISVKGLENIPHNQPVILAANHQNALLDALIIIFTTRMQPVFLARADIFKNKLVARILNYMKIAPVYRIRDGKSSLEKNIEVFENSVKILQNNKILCLFPEGAHIGMKSMLPHKKAIPRIVFIAAESTNFEMDIQIVPVGISYDHYFRFRRNAIISYGKPIHSKNYYDTYKEQGESKASVDLRDDLYAAIDKMVVNVPDKADYDLFEQAFEMMTPFVCEKMGFGNVDKNFVAAGQLITQKLVVKLDEIPAEKGEWLNKARMYAKLKEEMKFTESTLQLGQIGFFGLIKAFFVAVLLFPFAIYGTVANAWIFYLTRYPIRRILKDKQFYSTFSYGLSAIAYPIWFIIQFFILMAFFKHWAIALAFVLFSIPSGILAWELGQMLLRSVNRFKINAFSRKNDGNFIRLITLREELTNFFKQVLN